MIKLVALFIFLSFSVFAKTGEILSVATDSGTFPASRLCYFSNSTLATFQDGLIVKYTCFGGADLYSELWFVKGDQSKLLVSSRMGNLLSEVMTDGKKIYTHEFHPGGTQSLWICDLTSSIENTIPKEWKSYFFGAMIHRPDGSLGFMYRNGEESGEGQFINGIWSKLEWRGVSYFFNPAQTSEIIVQKVALGNPGEIGETRPTQVRVNDKVILEDNLANPESPFVNFMNYIVAQGKRWLVIGRSSQGQEAILGEGETYQRISLKFFKSVDYWPGAILSDGQFILRGKVADGRYGLWIWNKKEFIPYLLTTDKLQTSNGEFTIDPSSMFYTAPMSDGENIFVGLGMDGIGQGIFKF